MLKAHTELPQCLDKGRRTLSSQAQGTEQLFVSFSSEIWPLGIWCRWEAAFLSCYHLLLYFR